MSRILILALGAATAMLAAAGGSAAARTSAPPPKLGDLVVGAADLGPRTVVLADKTTKLGRLPFRVRVIETTKGGKPVILVVLAAVEHDANAAYAEFAETRTEIGLAGVRKHLTTFVASGFEWGKQLFGGKGGVKDVTLKKAIVGNRVSLGEKAFWVPMTIVLNKGTLRYDVAMLYADRAFASVTVLGLGGKRVAAGTVNALVAAEQHLLETVFTVANSSPPALAGTAQQGQTLTADAGGWTGSPTSFAYSWSRCDSTGATCAPINGATAKTYVPSAADTGATLRVDVTGSNHVSSAQAASPVTGIVA